METADAAGPPATGAELLQLARDQLEEQRKHPGLGAPDSDDLSRDFARSILSVDVDLASRRVGELPVEIIDVIKAEVTRLALNRNQLTGLSGLAPRIHECTRLQYLVLRHNEIREFPRSVLDLPELKYLDIRDNKIQDLPEDLHKLQNLSVLSFSKNRIKKLPLCFAQMRAITLLDATRNPITFPPQEAWTVAHGEQRKNSQPSQRDQDRCKEETRKILKYLREYIAQQKASTDEEMSESNAETPKPAKRKAPGRPPIRPSVSGIGLEHMATARQGSPPPRRGAPLLQRSYTELRSARPPIAIRPGLAPLVNNNERNRSNSESIMPTSVRDKRRGIISKHQQLTAMMKERETARLDVPGDRLSHIKSLSYGGVPPNGTTVPYSDSSGPGSPVEGGSVTPGTRLSILPEGRRRSRLNDPAVELSRAILYSVEQVARAIEPLLTRKKSGLISKSSSLERTWHIASHLIDDLTKQTETFIGEKSEQEEEGDRRKSQGSLETTIDACMSTFKQLCVNIMNNLPELFDQTSRRHLRTLQHMLYASLVELDIACRKRFADTHITHLDARVVHETDSTFSSPEPERPATRLRTRDVSGNGYTNGPLRGDSALLRAKERSDSNVTFHHNSPYSINAFTSSVRNGSGGQRVASNGHGPSDSEDAQFNTIWLRLNAACDMALTTLPACISLLDEAGTHAVGLGETPAIEVLGEACRSCTHARDTADDLKRRLTNFQIRDRQARHQPIFWQTCRSFTGAVTALIEQVRAMRGSQNLAHFKEIKSRLKPLYSLTKEVSHLTLRSPWRHLVSGDSQPSVQTAVAYQPSYLNMNGNGNGNGNSKATPSHRQPSSHATQSSIATQILPSTESWYTPPSSTGKAHTHPPLSLETRARAPTINTSDPSSAVSAAGPMSSGLATPLPATPMSAALGHAALATVPALQELPGAANGGYFNHGGGIQTATSAALQLDRSRSVSQRRLP